MFCSYQRSNRLFFTKKIHKCTYQEREKDPETGKEAFQLRLRDARIGRWLTTDPAEQYHSPYLGMDNSPVNGIDFDGGCFTSNTDDNGNTTYIPCANAGVGATTAGFLGNSWTMTENDGWQLTNGVPIYVMGNASYSPIDPHGSLDYYLNRHKKHIEEFNTRPPDYYLGYGHKYSNRFKNETRTVLSSDGKKWLDKTTISLQKLMEAGIRANPEIQLNNDVFQNFAYDTHVPAYTGNGILDL